MDRYEAAIVVILRILFLVFLYVMFTYPFTEPHLAYVSAQLRHQASHSPISAVLAGFVLLSLIGGIVQALAGRRRATSLMDTIRVIRVEYAARRRKKQRARPNWHWPAASFFFAVSAAAALLWLVDVSTAQPLVPSVPPQPPSADRTTFIITLWPVHTAVFSVAAAVIVFVLQSASARVGANLLTYFLRSTKIMAALATGVLGFVSIGLTALLPTVGLQIPMIAVVGNAIITLSHILLVISTLRLISVRTLRTGWTNWVNEIVTTMIEHEIETRVAVQGLKTNAFLARVQFSLWSDPPRNYLPVRSGLSGRVVDLDMEVLTQLASDAVPVPGELYLRAYPSRYVKLGDSLLYVPQGTDVDLVAGRLDKVFTIVADTEFSSPDAQMRGALKQLREQAYGALTNANPVGFREALDAYAAIFAAVQRTLTLYDAPAYPTDALSSDWYAREAAFGDWSTVLHDAIVSGEAALIREVAMHLSRLLEAFMEADDVSNFTRTARMYVMMYGTAAKAASDSAKQLARTAWDKLTVFSDNHIEKTLLDRSLSEAVYTRVARYLWPVFEAVCAIGQLAIDASDPSTVAHVCAYLDEFDRWRPDERPPLRAEDKAVAESLKGTCTQLITAIRFLLCAWATDRAGRGLLDYDQWRQLVRPAAAVWTDVTALTEASAALQSGDVLALLRWDAWQTEKGVSLPGRVSSIDPKAMNMEMRVRLFYALYGSELLAAKPHAVPMYAPLMDKVVPVLADLLQHGIPHPWADHVTYDSLSAFRDILNESVAHHHWEQENEIIASPLSATRVQPLQDGLRQRWGESGDGRTVTELLGNVIFESTPPAGVNVTPVEPYIYLNKAFLVAENGLSVDSIADSLWAKGVDEEYSAVLNRVSAVATPLSPGVSWIHDLSLLLNSPVPGAAVAAVFVPLSFNLRVYREDSAGLLGWQPDRQNHEFPMYEARMGTVPVFLARQLRDEVLLVRRNAVTLRLYGSGFNEGPAFSCEIASATDHLITWTGVPSEAVKKARERLLTVKFTMSWSINVAVAHGGAVKLRIPRR